MAVSRKGKRKIVVNDTVFYWYVKWDEDWFLENTLYILNENMQHILCYVVGKNITLNGMESPIWVESNKLNNPNQVSSITPKVVAQIIEWYLENKENEQ